MESRLNLLKQKGKFKLHIVEYNFSQYGFIDFSFVIIKNLYFRKCPPLGYQKLSQFQHYPFLLWPSEKGDGDFSCLNSELPMILRNFPFQSVQRLGAVEREVTPISLHTHPFPPTEGSTQIQQLIFDKGEEATQWSKMVL